jgi:predicted acetylornithine/succinylornithine family transaminase
LDNKWINWYKKYEWIGDKKMNIDIKSIEKKYFMNVYNRNDLIVRKAKKQFIWDINNKMYLDFFSGIGVCNLGHCNKSIEKAIKTQLNDFVHISNLFYSPVQIKLGMELIKRSFKNAKIFFSNSGAEANECAIKLVRKHWFLNVKKKYKNHEIICFYNSFHGRTLATISATGQKKFHDYLKPLQEKFVFARINDINSVKKLFNKKTIAIMIEPIQGEGGIITCEKSFLQELRAFCDNNNLILIFDEIQCGIGRTGKFFAFENYNVCPDIVTLAKSLANGLPLGATIAIEKFAKSFVYGDHGSTFGGNSVSCAAALEVLKIIDEKFLTKVTYISKYLYKQLEYLKKKYNIIKEIRGEGLMVGIDLYDNCKKFVQYCFNRGLIVNCTQDTVIRLLPPLIITKKDVDFAIKVLNDSFEFVSKNK